MHIMQCIEYNAYNTMHIIQFIEYNTQNKCIEYNA